jgi:hypothetical protein
LSPVLQVIQAPNQPHQRILIRIILVQLDYPDLVSFNQTIPFATQLKLDLQNTKGKGRALPVGIDISI